MVRYNQIVNICQQISTGFNLSYMIEHSEIEFLKNGVSMGYELGTGQSIKDVFRSDEDLQTDELINLRRNAMTSVATAFHNIPE